jgi:hypothetical protein
MLLTQPVPDKIQSRNDNATTTEEEVLIDEPLSRMPLKVRPIEFILENGGRGEPAFRTETDFL